MENNIESILNQVSSNPELMSKISEIASSGGENKLSDVIALISPLLASSSTNSSEYKAESIATSEAITDASISSEKNNSISALGTSFGKSIAKNKALLIALKPYLSKNRCDMIDSVIKISQIADVIKLI